MRYIVEKGASVYIIDELNDIMRMVSPPKNISTFDSMVFTTNRVMIFDDADIIDTDDRKVINIFRLPSCVNKLMDISLNRQLYIVVGKGHVKELAHGLV